MTVAIEFRAGTPRISVQFAQSAEAQAVSGIIHPEITPDQFYELLISQWDTPNMRLWLGIYINTIFSRLIDPTVRLNFERHMDRAEGVRLDWIGKRLGFNRPLSTAVPSHAFGFEGTGRDGFNRGNWASASSLFGKASADDIVYRRLLRLRGRGLLFDGTAGSMDAVMQACWPLGASFAEDASNSLKLIPQLSYNMADTSLADEQGIYALALEHGLIPKPAGISLGTPVFTSV